MKFKSAKHEYCFNIVVDYVRAVADNATINIKICSKKL